MVISTRQVGLGYRMTMSYVHISDPLDRSLDSFCWVHSHASPFQYDAQLLWPSIAIYRIFRRRLGFGLGCDQPSLELRRYYCLQVHPGSSRYAILDDTEMIFGLT